MRTLTVEHASISYDGGDPVLRDVSVSVRPGELLAVTGPSGAGKTTLLAAMAGLLRPATGRVLANDAPLGGRDHAVSLGVVLIPQDNGLAAILTAAENIAVAMIATGSTPAEARRGTSESLEKVGLAGHGDQLIEELSGGQQQRAAIARGLALRGDVLLADEVTSELDAANRQRVIELLRAEADRGAAVVFATHDLEAAAVCGEFIAVDVLDGEQRAGRVTAQHLRRKLHRAVAGHHREVLAVAALGADAPVADRHRAAQPGAHLVVVGDHHDGGLPFGVHGLHRREHLVAAVGVEAAGRLVDEQQARAGRDADRERSPLPSARREVGQPGPAGAGQADQVEDAVRLVQLDAFGVRGAALGQPDVSVQGRVRQQVARSALQHHADLGAAQARHLGVGELAHVVRADVDPPRGRAHQPGQQGDQRRLAGAGGADQREGLAGCDGQVDAGQRDDVTRLGAVDVHHPAARHSKTVHGLTIAKIEARRCRRIKDASVPWERDGVDTERQITVRSPR